MPGPLKIIFILPKTLGASGIGTELSVLIMTMGKLLFEKVCAVSVKLNIVNRQTVKSSPFILGS